MLSLRGTVPVPVLSVYQCRHAQISSWYEGRYPWWFVVVVVVVISPSLTLTNSVAMVLAYIYV